MNVIVSSLCILPEKGSADSVINLQNMPFISSTLSSIGNPSSCNHRVIELEGIFGGHVLSLPAPSRWLQPVRGQTEPKPGLLRFKRQRITSKWSNSWGSAWSVVLTLWNALWLERPPVWHLCCGPSGSKLKGGFSIVPFGRSHFCDRWYYVAIASFWALG